MGRRFFDISHYEAGLDAAIDSAMESFVADKAKELIQESIDNNVYAAHHSGWTGPPPDRRMKAGGIQDKANLFAEYSDHTLTIREIAHWQNKFGKSVNSFSYSLPPTSDLGEVIENNGIYGAPARPFMRTAEIIAQDRMDKILQTALLFEGF